MKFFVLTVLTMNNLEEIQFIILAILQPKQAVLERLNLKIFFAAQPWWAAFRETTKYINYRTSKIFLFATLLLNQGNTKKTNAGDLKNDLVVLYKQFTLILRELTLLGFIFKNVKEMRTLLQKLNIDDHYVINKLTEVAIRCSYMIYCKRNKGWSKPELLSYE